MGCLTAFFQLIFEVLYASFIGFMYIATFLFMIIKFIIKKIIQSNKKSKTVNKSYTKPQYQKSQNKEFNRLSDIEVIEEYEPMFESNINTKKEKSWKEKEFEREADLWGLSKEDREIAKEERMSPSEFIEAEEYNDDDLFLDEWER